MNLLAIDTATESCSAALWVDGKLYQKSTVQPRLHAEFILPFIDELLEQAFIKKADIDGIVVGQGPGAFTGVRIGVAVAQGLALALDVPVLGVSNLTTLAFAASQHIDTQEPLSIVVATDARMQEVYWARYVFFNAQLKRVTEEKVGPASTVDLKNCDVYIGSGFSVYSELIKYAETKPMTFETNVYSFAKDMLLMVKDDFEKLAAKIESIEPVYLREP